MTGRPRALWTANRGRVYTIVDQITSSLSNVVIAVAVAHSVSSEQYGIYAIAAGIYWVCLGSGRALIGELALIFWPELAQERGPRTGGLFTAGALVVGTLFGLPLAIVGVVIAEPALWVIGVFMPVLLAQDSIRYVMFATRRPHLALVADCIWLIAVAAGIGVVTSTNVSFGLGDWLAWWSIGAALSFVSVAVYTQTTPIFAGLQEVATNLRATALQLWGDFIVNQGAVQTVVFLLPLVASLQLLGALKAAQVAFGPVNNALNAGLLIAIPTAAALARAGRFGQARALGVKLGVVGLGIATMYTAALLVVPSSLGRTLFGATWSQASQLLVYVGLQYALGLFGTAALVVLRASKETNLILRARVGLAPLTLALPLLGAAVYGSTGLGSGLVAAAAAGAVLWWACLLRTTHRREAELTVGASV